MKQAVAAGWLGTCAAHTKRGKETLAVSESRVLCRVRAGGATDGGEIKPSCSSTFACACFFLLLPAAD